MLIPKPQHGPRNQAEAAPEWRAFWQGLRYAWPMFDGSGDIIDTSKYRGDAVVGSTALLGVPTEIGTAKSWAASSGDEYQAVSVSDFTFGFEDDWCLGAVFQVANTASDERVLISKWNNGTNRQFHIGLDRQAAPTEIEVRRLGNTRLLSGTVIELDTPYFIVLNHSFRNFNLKIYDMRTSALIDESSDNDPSEASVLTQPIRIGGRGGSDPWTGPIHMIAIHHRLLSEAEQHRWALNPFGPFTFARRRHAFVAAAAPATLLQDIIMSRGVVPFAR